MFPVNHDNNGGEVMKVLSMVRKVVSKSATFFAFRSVMIELEIPVGGEAHFEADFFSDRCTERYNHGTVIRAFQLCNHTLPTSKAVVLEQCQSSTGRYYYRCKVGGKRRRARVRPARFSFLKRLARWRASIFL